MVKHKFLLRPKLAKQEFISWLFSEEIQVQIPHFLFPNFAAG